MLAVAFAAAKAISLAQTFIIANTFGVGAEYDAYITANRAPELIVRLLAGGALGYAFIPVFSGLLAKQDRDGAWRMASQIANLIFIVALGASILAFFAAPWLVSTVYAPGFTPEVQAQTTVMLRILLISTLIFTISSLSTDVLQSHNHFLTPALAPILFDIGILIGVIFFLEPFGVYGIAWGAVLGAVMHLLTQIPALLHVKARWRPLLSFTDPTVMKVVRLMLPRVAGLGVLSFNYAILNNLASRLGEGSVSAFSWGFQLTQIPQTLLGTALSIVIFPTLAALSEAGEETAKREVLSGGLKFMLITTIPSAVGLIAVGRPLISILEGGAFDASATTAVYYALLGFSLTIVVQSILEISTRAFYADKDTLTPLWAGIVGAVATAGFAIFFSGVWSVTAGTAIDFGVGGLGLALSVGIAFEIAVLIMILVRRWQWNLWGAIGATLIKALTASAMMGVAVLAIGAIWGALGLSGQGRLLTLVQVGVMIGGGVIVFLLMATVLRIQEIWVILQAILRRQAPPIQG
jgi:putative peptidoglycan lipid II flippase